MSIGGKLQLLTGEVLGVGLVYFKSSHCIWSSISIVCFTVKGAIRAWVLAHLAVLSHKMTEIQKAATML